MTSSSSTVELFIASFNGEDGAGASLKDFQAAQRAGAIELIDAAVIVHTAEGKVKFEETADPSGKKWAKRGAIAGGVVGLIFPPSIIVSAAVGGGAGGIWGKIRDKGFKDEDLKEIGESLPPGSSAIIVIAGGPHHRAVGARTRRVRADRADTPSRPTQLRRSLPSRGRTRVTHTDS